MVLYSRVVSFGLRQALLIAAGGLGCSAVVVALARRQLMTLRYSLAWLAISFIGLLGALLTPLVAPISDMFGMSPTGVLLAGATVVLLAITLQLSISISGLQRRLRDLAEAHALLQSELARPGSRSPNHDHDDR